MASLTEFTGQVLGNSNAQVDMERCCRRKVVSHDSGELRMKGGEGSCELIQVATSGLQLPKKIQEVHRKEQAEQLSLIIALSISDCFAGSIPLRTDSISDTFAIAFCLCQ
jgi:hypothetical protein